jgi:hypothetical protein
VRLFDQAERLLQIDDVDAAPLREDVAAHLRVPAPRLVAEMHSGLQELAHGDDGQTDSSSVDFRCCRRKRMEPGEPGTATRDLRRVG